MCDALGRAHECFLALKKAGLSDIDIQEIINAKNNALAQAMAETYFFIVGGNKFELVYGFDFEIPRIEPLRLMREVNNVFLKNENIFDQQIFSLYKEESKPLGKIRAMLYRNTVPVSENMVRFFVSGKGFFSGFLGLVYAWHAMVVVAEEHKFPKSRPIFSFEDDGGSSFAARLINFGKVSNNKHPSYHLSAQRVKGRTFAANTYFLVLKDSE